MAYNYRQVLFVIINISTANRSGGPKISPFIVLELVRASVRKVVITETEYAGYF